MSLMAHAVRTYPVPSRFPTACATIATTKVRCADVSACVYRCDADIDVCNSQKMVLSASSEGARTKKSELLARLTCPITHQLFIDPVTAMDGRVYERGAITRCFEKSNRSPVTNVEIDPKLLDAHLVSDMIAAAIESGDIDGEAAEEWKQKTAEIQQTRQQLRDKRKALEDAAASGTDEKAIIRLAVAYESGQFGFAKDITKSIKSLRRGAENDLTTCMVFLALYLLRSPSNGSLVSGMSWLATAASAGNVSACMILGIAHAERRTLPECFRSCQFVPVLLQTSHDKSAKVAATWFRRALDGDATKDRNNILQEHHIKAIRQWLLAHGSPHDREWLLAHGSPHDATHGAHSSKKRSRK